MNGIFAVMSDMKARKSGTIVNMSSIAGRKVYEDHTVYCGTKYFVHAISESIRGYLSPHNVRVIVLTSNNCINMPRSNFYLLLFNQIWHPTQKLLEYIYWR